jgi:hypothetical protein
MVYDDFGYTKLGNILAKVATNIIHEIWQQYGGGGDHHYTQNLATSR